MHKEFHSEVGQCGLNYEKMLGLIKFAWLLMKIINGLLGLVLPKWGAFHGIYIREFISLIED